jgi:hypothetical protein
VNDAQQIAVIPKNRRESLVVRLYQYERHDLGDLRVFYTDPEGELRPTGKGASFAVRLLPEVIAGLQKALEEARHRGLLSGDA